MLAAPFMLLTALAIKLMEGPRATIFYRQVRVGQYGKPFRAAEISQHERERGG